MLDTPLVLDVHTVLSMSATQFSLVNLSMMASTGSLFNALCAILFM